MAYLPQLSREMLTVSPVFCEAQSEQPHQRLHHRILTLATATTNTATTNTRTETTPTTPSSSSSSSPSTTTPTSTSTSTSISSRNTATAWVNLSVGRFGYGSLVAKKWKVGGGGAITRVNPSAPIHICYLPG